MKRVVQAELLDALPPTDPRAVRSRRDLRLVNTLMGNHGILARALKETVNGSGLKQLTEIGAGDGKFLLKTARSLATRWPQVKVTLLDQREAVGESTLADFAALGWSAQIVVRDVREWAASGASAGEVIVANLFLHHFAERELSWLLQAIAARARAFVAVEPRRGQWPLFCSRLLWMLGCNSVTSYDAPVSVRAGFAGRELSALWPDHDQWELKEASAGAFSHVFSARRKH